MKDMNEYPCGNCPECPLVAEFVENADGLRDGAEAIGTAALGEDVEQIAEQVFETIPEGAALLGPDGEIRPVESPEDLITAMRASTTSVLEDMDARRERDKENIDFLTKNCGGPLKMRAEKAGKLVTVTVCMSPKAPEGEATEEATVHRESLARRR